MSSLSILIILYTLIRAGAFRCTMAKEFLIILLLYLIVYVTREIKPLMEAEGFQSIRTGIKTFSICIIDLTMFYIVFEIKLFQAKLSSESAF